MHLSTRLRFLLLLCAGFVRAKRCKGRVDVGAGCQSRCNFESGEWTTLFCDMYSNGDPEPTWCFDKAINITYDCRSSPGVCLYHCQSNNEGEGLCTCTYKNHGAWKMGERLSDETGDCRNKR